MDIRKAKLIHSVKCNQFYTVMRIDEDVGTIYIQPTKNRHNGITKSQIAHIEDNHEFQFVVMYDANTTAEQHFLAIMDSDCSIHVKQNEVKDFKKNMLMKSERAMQILKALSKVNSNDKLYKLASGTIGVITEGIKGLASILKDITGNDAIGTLIKGFLTFKTVTKGIDIFNFFKGQSDSKKAMDAFFQSAMNGTLQLKDGFLKVGEAEKQLVNKSSSGFGKQVLLVS